MNSNKSINISLPPWLIFLLSIPLILFFISDYITDIKFLVNFKNKSIMYSCIFILLLLLLFYSFKIRNIKSGATYIKNSINN